MESEGGIDGSRKGGRKGRRDGGREGGRVSECATQPQECRAHLHTNTLPLTPPPPLSRLQLVEIQGFVTCSLCLWRSLPTQDLGLVALRPTVGNTGVPHSYEISHTSTHLDQLEVPPAVQTHTQTHTLSLPFPLSLVCRWSSFKGS